MAWVRRTPGRAGAWCWSLPRAGPGRRNRIAPRDGAGRPAHGTTRADRGATRSPLRRPAKPGMARQCQMPVRQSERLSWLNPRRERHLERIPGGPSDSDAPIHSSQPLGRPVVQLRPTASPPSLLRRSPATTACAAQPVTLHAARAIHPSLESNRDPFHDVPSHLLATHSYPGQIGGLGSQPVLRGKFSTLLRDVLRHSIQATSPRDGTTASRSLRLRPGSGITHLWPPPSVVTAKNHLDEIAQPGLLCHTEQLASSALPSRF